MKKIIALALITLTAGVMATTPAPKADATLGAPAAKPAAAPAAAPAGSAKPAAAPAPSVSK